jgi:hypothetical protein
LKQLHGADGELRIDCTDHGARVEMIVPYRRIAAAADVALASQGLPP